MAKVKIMLMASSGKLSEAGTIDINKQEDSTIAMRESMLIDVKMN